MHIKSSIQKDKRDNFVKFTSSPGVYLSSAHNTPARNKTIGLAMAICKTKEHAILKLFLYND